MARLNKEEYEILKECDDKFKWVARDKNTELWVYTKKPYKGMYRWDSVGNINLLPRRSKYLFRFIQWDDEEPYRISDLIKEYEDRGDIGYALEEYAEYIIKFSEKLLTESEEKMKKDIEWAKKEIKELITEESQNYPHDEMVEKEIVLGILNQLDEPEVLSQKWIEENRLMKLGQEDIVYYVAVDDLQNLIVPKQELPVIPKFVADWIVDLKSKRIHLLESIYDFTHGEDIHDYIREQGDTLMRAWLDGYTVEKEPLYYAKIKGHELVSDNEDGYWNVDGKDLYIDNIWHDYSGYKTTKLSKYDWNSLGINEDNADFIKVEELEE